MLARFADALFNFRLTDCLVLAILLLAGCFASAQDYSLTKLPALTEPVAVNSSGQVAGTTTQTGHDLSFFGREPAAFNFSATWVEAQLRLGQ